MGRQDGDEEEVPRRSGLEADLIFRVQTSASLSLSTHYALLGADASDTRPIFHPGALLLPIFRSAMCGPDGTFAGPRRPDLPGTRQRRAAGGTPRGVLQPASVCVRAVFWLGSVSVRAVQVLWLGADSLRATNGPMSCLGSRKASSSSYLPLHTPSRSEQSASTLALQVALNSELSGAEEVLTSGVGC
eukprot:4942-Rhodomonas_salina.1